MKCPICKKDCFEDTTNTFRCPEWNELNPNHRYEYLDGLLDSTFHKDCKRF